MGYGIGVDSTCVFDADPFVGGPEALLAVHSWRYKNPFAVQALSSDDP
jgi:hypothetical protein